MNDTTQEKLQSEVQEEVKVDEVRVENTKAEPNEMKSRLISMLVLAVSLGVAGSVLLALIIGQTLFSVFTKEPNDSMKELAQKLSDYVYKTLQYLGFNSEERPFPYQAWEEKGETLVNSENAEQSV